MVYLHTSIFGKNQLIAGSVICTYVKASFGRTCETFINTNFGILKYQNGRCTNRLNTSLGESSGSACKVYSSVEAFRSGKELEFLETNAPVDVYGLSYKDDTHRSCGDFNVYAHFVSGTTVVRGRGYIYNLLFDESNNRVVPANSLTNNQGETRGADYLRAPRTKDAILEAISKSSCRNRKTYATYEEALAELQGTVEIIGLDGNLVVEKPKEPTLKDKLQEFVNQQGTSLEMLRTIINEL